MNASATASPGGSPTCCHRIDLELVANRGAITACVILSVIMQALDTTIAYVALPDMQGSVSASADQINWVLTSYIVAAAIMTPPSGYLSSRFGRKRVLLTAVAGFVIASILCGLSQSLIQIVAFRLIQGLFGAALCPSLRVFCWTSILSRSGARPWPAVWYSVMVGPVLGPVIGGWLIPAGQTPTHGGFPSWPEHESMLLSLIRERWSWGWR